MATSARLSSPFTLPRVVTSARGVARGVVRTVVYQKMMCVLEEEGISEEQYAQLPGWGEEEEEEKQEEECSSQLKQNMMMCTEWRTKCRVRYIVEL